MFFISISLLYPEHVIVRNQYCQNGVIQWVFPIFNKNSLLHLLRLTIVDLKYMATFLPFFIIYVESLNSKISRFKYCKVVICSRETNITMYPLIQVFINFTFLWYKNALCWEATWENLLLALESKRYEFNLQLHYLLCNFKQVPWSHWTFVSHLKMGVREMIVHLIKLQWGINNLCHKFSARHVVG